MSVIGGPGIVLDNLVLYIDGLNSKSAPAGGSEWTDISGLKRTTTLGGGYTLTGEYVDITNTSGYCEVNFPDTQNFTVSIAIRYNASDILSNNQHYAIITNASGGSQSSIGEYQKFDFRFNRSGTGRTFAAQLYETNVTLGTQGVNLDGPSFEDAAYDGTWSVHTFTLSDTDFVYYINGVYYSNNSSFTAANLQTYNSFRICNPTSGSWYTPLINVSYMTIYNRGLEPDEVLSNYNATKGRLT